MPEIPGKSPQLFDLLLKIGEKTYDDTPSALDAVLKEWKLWGSTRTSVLNRALLGKLGTSQYGPELQEIIKKSEQQTARKFFRDSHSQRKAISQLFPGGLVAFRVGDIPDPKQQAAVSWNVWPEGAVRPPTHTGPRPILWGKIHPKDVITASSSLGEGEVIARNPLRRSLVQQIASAEEQGKISDSGKLEKILLRGIKKIKDRQLMNPALLRRAITGLLRKA